MFRKKDSYKSGDGAHSAKAAAEDMEERPERRAKRLRLRLILALAVLALVILALVALPMLSPGTAVNVTAVESVVSGTAGTGDISSIFSGSGTLTDQKAEDILLPETVEVLGFPVRNGQKVSAGDALAQVDRDSVMRAIAQLQETIDQIDEDMESAAANSVTSTLTAPADGRIMAVYAQEGDQVLDVMYEHSALMLISLDGLAAVDVAGGSLGVGDRPTVRLPDGTELKGRVDALNNGVATVTFSDEDVAIGDAVSVLDGDGRELGGGTLYIHSELKLTGFSGTVSELYVFAGSQVLEGQSLILLDGTDYQGDYMKLLSQREEYAEQLDMLFETYQDGYVHAEFDGIVTGISDDAKYISLADHEGAGSVATLLSAAREDGPRLTLLSSAAAPTATYAKYAGKIASVSGSSLTANINPTAVSMTTDASALANMDEAEFTTSANGSFADAVVYIYQSGAGGGSSTGGLAAGDLVLITVKTETDGSTSITQIDCLRSSGSGQGSGGMSGGAGGGGAASGGTASTEVEEETAEEKENVLCGLIPGETMTVVISVDELDVLDLKVGQSATVTLDAISGKSCAGTVTAIDPAGVNDGGSTKYSMTITIERTDDMLSGMNASAQITVGETLNVLTIPAAAIFEDGSGSYVYTEYDEKNDRLLSPVELTLGVSDGVNVEVLGGLGSGDKYYYRYAETLVYGFS